jgi:hypothetical protein
MNIDDFAEPREDDVRGPWQITPVEAKSIAEAVDQSAHDHFGLGVFRPYRRHGSRSLGFRQSFGHVPNLGARAAMGIISPTMSNLELQSLKSDFLEWTGGFEPETEDDIAAYVNTSMPLDLDPAEARDALREWMQAATTS